MEQLSQWFGDTLCEFIEFLGANKGSVKFDFITGKQIEKDQFDQIQLIKPQQEVQTFWWGKIFPVSEKQTVLPKSEIEIFDEILNLIRGLTFYERISNVKQSEEELGSSSSFVERKSSFSACKNEKVKFILNSPNIEIKEKLKAKITQFTFIFDKNNRQKINDILVNLCGSLAESKRLSILSNYQFFTKIMAEQLKEYRRKSNSYETMFKLVTVLKNIWKLASRYPDTWKLYVSQNSGLVEDLYKAAFDLEDVSAF